MEAVQDSKEARHLRRNKEAEPSTCKFIQKSVLQDFSFFLCRGVHEFSQGDGWLLVAKFYRRWAAKFEGDGWLSL